MPTQASFIAFLLDQLAALPGVQARQMFGEYAVYVHDKLPILVCDDTVYLKPTPAGQALLDPDAAMGAPYPGAKDHLRLGADTLEDADRLVALVRATAEALPAPRPKKPKARAPKPKPAGPKPPGSKPPGSKAAGPKAPKA